MRVRPQVVEIVDRLRKLVQPRLQRGHRALERRFVDLGHERLDSPRELLIGEGADVLAVDPVELLPVETRARVLNALEGEGLDELLEGEDLLLGARIPAQQG